MQRFKKLLCVMEHGEESKPALERAAALAANNQASLTVVDVIPLVSAGIGLPGALLKVGELQNAMLREREDRLKRLVEPYREHHDIEYRVLVGTSFLEIVREVLRNNHDLVVKCPESPSWLDRLFAGDDMHLLRKCPCPVWLIKPHSTQSFDHILAAVDVNESYPTRELHARHLLNVQIVEMAATLALAESADLHVVHAWSSVSDLVEGLAFSPNLSEDDVASNLGEERKLHQVLLDTLLQNIKAASNAAREALDYLKPRTYLLQGSPRKEVPILAGQLSIDCIVMGTVGRTGVRGFFMGNTAETILEQIDCSVLAIKPEGFVTPVSLEDD